jgi:hypothetical protein
VVVLFFQSVSSYNSAINFVRKTRSF